MLKVGVNMLEFMQILMSKKYQLFETKKASRRRLLLIVPYGRKHNKGTLGNKGGRPSKAEEQALAEKLSPLDDMVFNALRMAIENGHHWAVKLFFQYRYGRPKEIKGTYLFAEQPFFEISFMDCSRGLSLNHFLSKCTLISLYMKNVNASGNVRYINNTIN